MSETRHTLTRNDKLELCEVNTQKHTHTHTHTYTHIEREKAEGEGKRKRERAYRDSATHVLYCDLLLYVGNVLGIQSLAGESEMAGAQDAKRDNSAIKTEVSR